MVLACLLAEFDLSVCGELVTGGIGINLSVLGEDYKAYNVLWISDHDAVLRTCGKAAIG